MVPYGNQLNYQTDYRGAKKLAKKYAIRPVKDIYAKLVHEGDLFEESIEGGNQTFVFKPKAFNDGKIIGAFAVCLYVDGGMQYDTMSLGYEQAIETFAVIAAIKIHDGRIYGANRDWMNSVSYNPEAAVRSRENPVIYAGLDDIHTAHINQIITALRKMKEA